MLHPGAISTVRASAQTARVNGSRIGHSGILNKMAQKKKLRPSETVLLALLNNSTQNTAI